MAALRTTLPLLVLTALSACPKPKDDATAPGDTGACPEPPGTTARLVGEVLADDYTVLLSEGDDRQGDTDDWLGTVLESPGDLTGDGVADVLVTGPHDDDAAGRAWVGEVAAGGVRNWFRVSREDASFVDDSFGQNADGRGDVDGDGAADLVVGDMYWEGEDDGAVAVFYGPITSNRETAAGRYTELVGTGGLFGFTAASVGDLDGDGADDLAASSYADRRVVVCGGLADGRVSTDACALGTYAAEEALTPLTPQPGPHDVDEDGVSDLVLLAGELVPEADTAGEVARGRLLAFVGPPHDTVEADAAVRIDVDGIGWTSRSTAWVDLDCDGHEDLVLGAGDAKDGVGAVFVVPGPLRSGEIDGLAKARVDGAVAFAGVGSAVSAGDFDGDGLADVATIDHGQARLLFGPLEGTRTPGDADLAVSGRTGTDLGGLSNVAGPADTNVDGVYEILVSQERADLVWSVPIGP